MDNKEFLNKNLSLNKLLNLAKNNYKYKIFTTKGLQNK